MIILKNKIVILLFNLFFYNTLIAQKLSPGFDKNEYLDVMNVSAHSYADTNYNNKFEKPTKYFLKYQSPEMGLVNQWTLWSNNKDRLIINIRGTTQSSVSWLANFYAAMVPAEGELELDTNFTFKYKLAKNPSASVHIGWLVGTAYLSRDILPKIDSAYKKGVRNIIITGHSQGGGISYLLTAYLHYLQEDNKLPKDIIFKTYSSAAPKPGNLFFAYDYESFTQSGWAYNVVNAADWVPEVPFSIQTVNDFNKINPFTDAKTVIKKQKFPANIAMKHVYNQLDKPTKKAQKNYQKYLGKMASKFVRQNLPNYKSPNYVNSNNYVRTGQFIVLEPKEDYYKKFIEKDSHVFIHHLHEPYVYLANQLKTINDESYSIIGEWNIKNILNTENIELNIIQRSSININEMGISGNIACNSFSYPCQLKNESILMSKKIASTMMLCAEENMKIEKLFFEKLELANQYKIEKNQLLLMKDNEVLIVLSRD